MIGKYESRRIKVDIRHVLMDVWDPIGIKDEPKAQDEYDSYLGGVYGLLVGGLPMKTSKSISGGSLLTGWGYLLRDPK
jgi:hypothetical protein